MDTYLAGTKGKWKDMTKGQFNHYSGKFISNVKSDLGIKSQKTIGSTNHSDPQNNEATKSGSGKDSETQVEKGNKKSKTSKTIDSKSKGKSKGKVSKSKTAK